MHIDVTGYDPVLRKKQYHRNFFMAEYSWHHSSYELIDLRVAGDLDYEVKFQLYRGVTEYDLYDMVTKSIHVKSSGNHEVKIEYQE